MKSFSDVQKNTLKILVAEDNHSLRDLLRDFLESQGCHVREASHGPEALALCSRETFDVILTDIHMPGLTGIEFLRRLPEKNKRAAKIMMSGDASIEEVVHGFKQEIDDFIIKPFVTTAIVWQAIERQIVKIGLERELEFKNRVMHCYHEILQFLTSNVDTEGLCDYTFQALKKILPLARMELLLLDPKRKNLSIRYIHSDHPLLSCPGDWERVENSGFESSLESGSYRIISDMSQNGFHGVFLKNALKEGMQSVLLFPLHVHEELYGWMNFYSTEKQSYNEKHVEILDGILPNISVSFERALYQGKLSEENTFLRLHLKTLSHQFLQQQESLIFSLAELSEERDKETGAHLHRMREFAKLLAGRYFANQARADAGYGMMDTQHIVDMIFKTAPLHDIGKVGVPDSVLLKPGKLTPEEFAVMRTHTKIGAECLSKAAKRVKQSEFLMMGKDIALYHHEKWDGTGYPENLKGLQIPLAARIIALADNYDALRSKRVYKPAWDHDSTCRYLQNQSGRHFDPDLIAAFFAIEKEFEKTYSEHNDEGSEPFPLNQLLLSLT